MKDSGTFGNDAHVLAASESKVRARFGSSFSDADINQIECLAWADYRRQNPTGSLDPDKFARYAADAYGGLKITSTPEGAAISVDDKPWTDPTNAQEACRIGVRRVKLSKSGYQDETGEAKVQQGQWTVFHKDLKPK